MKKRLCDKCNKLATEHFREEFFNLIRNNKKKEEIKLEIFLKRLRELIFDTTGAINPVLYIDNKIEEIKELRRNAKRE